jgi:DNA-binding transcriptional MocR family regulator
VRIEAYCAAVIQGGKLSMPAQAVLWMTARYVKHETGETFVSVETIARACHVNRETVRIYIGELVAAGVITRRPRPGRSAVIRFPIHPALSTARGQSRGVDRGTSRDVPRGNSIHTPRNTVGNPAEQPSANSYNPLEPAPRCHRCDERHNVDARCPALAAAR